MSLPIGMIMLLVVAVLVFFGVAQRILDRMRLTDKQALAFIAAMIVGSFINIPILRTPVALSINVGGAVLPAILAIWLIVTADETSERVRAIAASIFVLAAIMLGGRYLPSEPETMFMDTKLLYGIAAGIIAYLIGRSRRSAFIGSILGTVLSDLVHFVTIYRSGIAGTTSIGGAGVFDVVVIAVMLAELVGETREKIQGGPVLGPNRPEGLYEFSREFRPEEPGDKDKPQESEKNKAEADKIGQKRGEKHE